MEQVGIHAVQADREDWRNRYRLPPRGIGYLESEMAGPNSSAMLGYRIAKSAYQQRPDVFNLQWLAKETGLDREAIATRIRRLYADHLVMFAAAPAVHVYGFGLYYWFGKFRRGAFAGVREISSESAASSDAIWNSYETSGAFDFVHAACASTLDKLIWDVVSPEAKRPQVDWIRICPVARALRYEHVNLWDTAGDQYREYEWGSGEAQELAARQQELDETDVRLILALNRKRPVRDWFDFNVLSEVSGLDRNTLAGALEVLVERHRQLVPLIYLNWQKLGLTQTIFAVRLRAGIPLKTKSRIADDLATVPEFHTVWQFSDAHYDIGLMACTQTVDLASLRERIESAPELDSFDEGTAAQQQRYWGCRLDEFSGMWEQCAFPGSGLAETRA